MRGTIYVAEWISGWNDPPEGEELDALEDAIYESSEHGSLEEAKAALRKADMDVDCVNLGFAKVDVCVHDDRWDIWEVIESHRWLYRDDDDPQAGWEIEYHEICD